MIRVPRDAPRTPSPFTPEEQMKKTPLNVDTLQVESFDPQPHLVSLPGAGRGTACWELCAADPTSNPDHDTCGAAACV